MRLLLASYLHPDLETFFQGRIAYINDAVSLLPDIEFASEERKALGSYGLEVTDLTVRTTSIEEIREILESVDGVYVASGQTFELLQALKASGAFEILQDLVHKGLPYAGSSAGAVLAAPSIAYIAPMEEPEFVPDLRDCTGLGLTQLCVVPHAQGTLALFPATTIAEIVEKSANSNLVLLHDGQALLIDDTDCRII